MSQDRRRKARYKWNGNKSETIEQGVQGFTDLRTRARQQDNKRTIEKIRVIHIQNIRVEASHLGLGLQLRVSV